MWFLALFGVLGAVSFFALEAQILPFLIVLGSTILLMIAVLAATQQDDAVYILVFFIIFIGCIYGVRTNEIGYNRESSENVRSREIEKQEVNLRMNVPRIVEVPVGNGCTIVYHYPNQNSNTYHDTKFVRCPTEKTVLYEKYACGKRTCTREIETIPNTKEDK